MTINNNMQKYNNQHNDIKYNNIQHYSIKYNDIQHDDIKYNDIQHNNIQFNDTQHNSKKERYFVKQICHAMFWLVCSLTKHSSSSCLDNRVSPEWLGQ
jgi:hypothetical protein